MQRPPFPPRYLPSGWHFNNKGQLWGPTETHVIVANPPPIRRPPPPIYVPHKPITKPFTLPRNTNVPRRPPWPSPSHMHIPTPIKRPANPIYHPPTNPIYHPSAKPIPYKPHISRAPVNLFPANPVRAIPSVVIAPPPFVNSPPPSGHGNFWIVPPNLPESSKPIIDPDSGDVVGFTSGGMVYDLNGSLKGEKPLEPSFIQPADVLLAVGGIFRGIGKAGAKAGFRAASEEAAGGLVSRLGRATIEGLRAAYRSVRFSGPLKFTKTTTAHMMNPARHVPVQILKLAIKFGKRVVDPQGVGGAFRYEIPMFRNGARYNLEVVFHETTKTVLHFGYK